MKLLAAAICLLCCAGCAFGQSKVQCPGDIATDITGKEVCVRPLPAPTFKADGVTRVQLICDWAGDHFYCPTRKPISDLDGKLAPQTIILSGDTEPIKSCEETKGTSEACLLSFPPYTTIDCSNVLGGCEGYKPPPPFDVEPIFGAPPTERANLICEDKSRFLLFSADGKGHCLKLVP